MEIDDFLKPTNVLVDFITTSKKQTLETLTAHLVKETNINHHKLLMALHQRERLGSTGVGSGVAIPHARLRGIDNTTGLFVRLKTPIPFDSIDNSNVDLIFMLLMPEGAGANNLKSLAKVSKYLRQQIVREKLRAAKDVVEILKIFQ
jgi:PTS system nitrogen regulatory IIA component